MLFRSPANEFLMTGNFAREAAKALLQWSRIADRDQSIGLVEKAADLKDRAGELPAKTDLSLRAPDVQSER